MTIGANTLRAALLSSLCLAAPAWAQAPTTDRATAGSFSVLQIATTDSDALMRAWAQPVAVPHLTTAKGMARNQVITTYVVFSGCRPDAAGACNVTADFDVVDPRGKAYAHVPGAEVWVGRHAPPPGAVELSAGALALRVENNEPVGVYRVRATVTDHNAGKTVRTEQALVARP